MCHPGRCTDELRSTRTRLKESREQELKALVSKDVRAALTQAGIAADRIKKISYGKEKPFCTESTEECWQQNRRAHFVFGQQ